MSSLHPPISSASVRNILTLLASRDAQVVAGSGGLERRVTWSCRMRARLPAFESIRGGELALLTLTQLRRLDETLPHLLKSLHNEGVAAVAVAAPSFDALDDESRDVADQYHLPLILLPQSAALEEIEREVITFVVSFRGEIERKATEVSHQLMQLSIQGAGFSGLSDHLASSIDKWVVIQDTDQHIRYQAQKHQTHPTHQTHLCWVCLVVLGVFGLGCAPILIRHEVVGYLSFIGNDGDFDYLERIIIGQVAPILALEFARERERSQVENRYQVEALMDVLQGNYQQPEEMLTRTRFLGYDLSIPQVVAVFEIPPGESDYPADSPQAQWSKRIRDELLRTWPGCWISSESRRVVALLPLTLQTEGAGNTERENENTIFNRLERILTRLQPGKGNNTGLPLFSCGLGRVAANLVGIPQSFREAQQSLEIGQRLFGNGKLHSFARLGIYRLLFYLDGQSELTNFYYEILGPLLDHDPRGDSTLIETLEGFFRCNGNLSETARTMHLHRNSLLYRLGRIEELLGQSLENPELRLSLQIALKIHHLQHPEE